MRVCGHFHAQSAVGNFKDGAGGEKDQQKEQYVAQLKPLISGFCRELVLHGFALGHPPQQHEADRHGDSAGEQPGAATPEAAAGIVGQVADDGIG